MFFAIEMTSVSLWCFGSARSSTEKYLRALIVVIREGNRDEKRSRDSRAAVKDVRMEFAGVGIRECPKIC